MLRLVNILTQMHKYLPLGTRCIVLATGCYRTGVLPESIVVYQGSSENKGIDDYHSDMNSSNFLKYCQNLFPSIQGTPTRKSIFVIDNARYHTSATAESRYPPKSGKKSMRRSDLLEWMKERKLEVPGGNDKATVAMLHSYIRKNWVQKSEIVELGSTYNIIVLYLPPYYHILNPIEKIWAHVKPQVRGRNRQHSIKNVQEQIRTALKKSTVHEWRQIEDTYIKPFENEFYEAAKKGLNEVDIPDNLGSEYGEDELDDFEEEEEDI